MTISRINLLTLLCKLIVGIVKNEKEMILFPITGNDIFDAVVPIYYVVEYFMILNNFETILIASHFCDYQ